MCPKCIPNGFTQKWSVSSGSRAVMWPATPSSNPNLENRRNAAAKRCLRWSRSSTMLNWGGAGNRVWPPPTSLASVSCGVSVSSDAVVMMTSLELGISAQCTADRTIITMSPNPHLPMLARRRWPRPKSRSDIEHKATWVRLTVAISVTPRAANLCAAPTRRLPACRRRRRWWQNPWSQFELFRWSACARPPPPAAWGGFSLL